MHNFQELPPNYVLETHTCEGYKEGDWVIFTCKKCPGYERRINLRTREVRVVNARDHIKHTGFYVSPLAREIHEN